MSGRARYDELPVGVRKGRKGAERLRDLSPAGGIAGACDLGRYVPTGNGGDHLLRRRYGPVGLHLYAVAGPGEQGGQLAEARGLLEQGLSASDHHIRRRQSLDPGGRLLRPHVHHLLVVVETRPVPGVGGVAPAAGQVARRKPDERRGRTCRAALALNRQEYLRLTRGSVCSRAARRPRPRFPAQPCAAGSGTPASAKPRARRTHESHSPQGMAPPR